eukprot:1137516-Pelagomonas_calceolata.AAC.4
MGEGAAALLLQAAVVGGRVRWRIARRIIGNSGRRACDVAVDVWGTPAAGSASAHSLLLRVRSSAFSLAL